MGSIFSKPKAPDTSKQEAALAAQEARISQQEKDAAAKQAASLKARRAKIAGGKASLITGDETGVLRTTLG